MHQFTGSDDGRAQEAAIQSAVSRLKDLFPAIDAAAVEAHLTLARTYDALIDMRAPYWAKFGITGPRFVILRLLYLAEGQRASMSEIAADLNKGMANITQLIDGLVQDRLVERIADPVDRRVVQAHLTVSGEALFASVFPQNAERIQEAWAPLSEQEKKLMVHLLARIHMHLLDRRTGAEQPMPEAIERSDGDDRMQPKGRGTARRSPRRPSVPEVSPQPDG